MPRARWLKPEFFRDRKMAEAGPLSALVYQSLWVTADDGGMARCDPDRLKGEMFCFWKDVGVPEIIPALRRLHSLGRITFFQGSDELFCQIVTWERHQKVHKPSRFRYRQLHEDFRQIVPEWCGTSEAPVRVSPPPRLLDSQTPRPQESQLQGGASRPAKRKADASQGTPTFRELMGLVRAHLYTPDGKPASGWDEARDGSILKELLKHDRADEVAIAIEGLAILRDFPGVYADAVDWPYWPQPGQKADLRPLYNNKSGVLPVFSLAMQAYWKHANGRAGTETDRPPMHIGDLLRRNPVR